MEYIFKRFFFFFSLVNYRGAIYRVNPEQNWTREISPRGDASVRSIVTRGWTTHPPHTTVIMISRCIIILLNFYSVDFASGIKSVYWTYFIKRILPVGIFSTRARIPAKYYFKCTGGGRDAVNRRIVSSRTIVGPNYSDVFTSTRPSHNDSHPTTINKFYTIFFFFSPRKSLGTRHSDDEEKTH